ncbi:MAG: branched-chain amino acid ABC transporter permease [Deltaproteobacteria bacterium]|nr:branched-chain amino acid ABC transporter permease [Deltaproteobacteria bacterium]
MDFFLQLLIGGMVMGGIYALVALGFVLIYKTTGVINFAQGEFLLVGAYVCLALMAQLQLTFWVAFLLTMGVSVLLGLIIERLVLRPMIGKPIISVIMLTIGLSSVLKCLVLLVWGPHDRVYPPVFSQTPLALGNLIISPVYLWALGVTGFFLVLFGLFFRYTAAGLALRAVVSDLQASRSVGIKVGNSFALAWCLAFMLAGGAGVFLGNINVVNVSLSFYGLKVLPAVILGGLDSFAGAIAGGLLIGLLEVLAGAYLDPLVGGGAQEVIPFIVLLIVLLVKPYGLWGKSVSETI